MLPQIKTYPQIKPTLGSLSACARNPKLLWVAGIIAALPLTAFSQAKRCDLVGRDTTLNGVPTAYKRCLDLGALDGQTITVPDNVTRIDNDGLSLCKDAVQTGGKADIVYVYDNSGSMGASLAYVNGTDTTFYYADDGCTSSNLSGKVTYTAYKPNGLDTVSKTIDRLVSDAGCTAYSGDPYNARGAAFRQGIDHQASRAPTSTAGIMSFSTTVGNIQHPLVLNPANLTTIRGKINATTVSSTYYLPPLDSAKNWLVGVPPLTSNPNKAIIFLSDGRPTDFNYKQVLDSTYRIAGKMPPIYGIFLGRPRIDTAALAELASLTGGKFYLIPPTRPDSMIAVVEKILNIILLEFQPTSATVTNNSVSPIQTANTGTADFILQVDGSWLMKLDNIIGLRASNANSISVATVFKEKVSGAIENKIVTFTLKTTDPASSTSQKITNTQFAVECFDPSALRILNAAGVRPAFFSDANTEYQVRLRTAVTPLDSTTIPAETKVKADAETALLSSPLRTTDSLVFQGKYPFSVSESAAKTNQNGTLESRLFDSIIVSWVHPRDPQDYAYDTVPVRASKQQAIAYFSATEGGPALTTYPSTATMVFVVVKDQSQDKRKAYTAVITSENLLIDRETVTLTEAPDGSGTMVGKLAIELAAKNPGDNRIQVLTTGDQFRVVYRDPVDGDSAVGTAGFDQTVEEAADLQFTDESGNPLPADSIWSPAQGKLYVSYSDDYVNGTIDFKNVTLTLGNKKYGALFGTDKEKLTVDLVPGTSSTRATWRGTINLTDTFPSKDSNGTAETHYRGEATISVNGHNNRGTLDAAAISDFLVIAYPDSQAGLQWKMADSGSVPAGTEGLIVTISDQDFTTGKNDSVYLTVACLKSGDSVANFPAWETTSQTYLSGILVKDESAPNASDRILSCLTTDQIRVTYVDPVYGTQTELLINEVAKPEANPPGRKFTTFETVTLTSATPGAIIYYTLDGSIPVPGTSAVYTDPLRIGLTSTVKAIAIKSGWKNSKILSQSYTKESVASRLEILDENGNQISGGIITGASKSLRIKLVTTQDNLLGVNASTRTLNFNDAESVALNNFNFLGTAFEYSEGVALKHPSGKASGNDTINATGTDTLIAQWINPFNPLDMASDTVIIKPAFVSAEVYFSTSEGGARITQYPTDQDTIFIVVKTRPKDPGMEYVVSVSSSETGADKEILTLKELSPGVYSAKAPVSAGTKITGDAIIQVAAAGDQLKAIFKDPVYLDSYQGDAGFAQQVQESASLEFLDAAGNPLAPADIWSPEKGKVYLRFMDDWSAGIDALVDTITAHLVLSNKKSGAVVGTDSETVILILKGTPAGTRGTWEGQLTLVDKSAGKKGNDTLESYYRGELTATVTPHDNAGSSGGPDIQDHLIIAYPNQSAEVVIQDTAGKPVSRETEKVDILIHDQVFTRSGESSINAQVGCTQSGDKVATVTLVWDGKKYAIQPPLDKGEIISGSVDKNDALLLCRDSDMLVVTYTDPVFMDTRMGEIRWNDDPQGRLYYASSRDTAEITSVSDAVDEDFLVVLEGKSLSRDKVDTMMVTLTTAQGEKETYRAIETGVLTGKYIVQVKFLFQSGNPAPENQKLEGKITLVNRINQVLVKGQAEIGGEVVKADISLFSTYNLISRGYIKDLDENGRGDHVYLVFDHKLKGLPTGLDSVYWNQVRPEFSLKVGSGKLSFLEGSDSTVVVADFSASQFGPNLTAIPDGQAPYALLPDDNIFGGQKPGLNDSIGVVMVTANKLPSNLQSYDYSGTEKRFNPDTLIITVSEKIKTSVSSFNGMLRFSKGCSEYAAALPIQTFSEPRVSPDGLTWTLIVDNTPDSQTPLIGDCLFLEAGGQYTDMLGNRPGRLGVPLSGENPKLVIRTFRGFPPVAGMDPETPGFVLVTNDNRNDQNGVFSNQIKNGSWEVLWIPPYGFEESNPIRSLQNVADNFTDAQSQERRPEAATPRAMPRNISAVQVITSGSYKAQIHIYDNLGHFVRYMEQAYGLNGEDKNPWRATDKGQLSFLVWDLKDKDGQMAGQGVYVWKVNFLFVEKNKKSEVRFTRTGVMRN